VQGALGGFAGLEALSELGDARDQTVLFNGLLSEGGAGGLAFVVRGVGAAPALVGGDPALIAVDRQQGERLGQEEIMPNLAISLLDPGTQLRSILLLAGFFMLVSATQDIATDGLAVRSLRARERGLGNGLQVGGYYLGQVLGGGVMFGSGRDGDDNDTGPTPAGAFSAYVVVDEPDALCERVRAGGAQVIVDLHDTEYGSRDFAAPRAYVLTRPTGMMAREA